MKNLLIIALLVVSITAQGQSEKSNKSATDKQLIEKLINENGDSIKSSSVERY